MGGGKDGLVLYGDKDLASPYVMSVAVALAMHEDVMPDRLARYAAHPWSRPSVKAWLALERPREAAP